LFRISMPPELGEGGRRGPEALRVIEELSRIDGSTGWTAASSFISDYFTAMLDDEVATKIVGGPRAYLAGRGGQPGHAVEVDGGYRISGQWAYVSGCPSADWITLDALIFDGQAPRMQPSGMPQDIFFFCPRSDVKILDTWRVSGLKGSGSHDVVLNDCFVPQEFAAPGMLSMTLGFKRMGPAQRMPLMLVLAIHQAPPVCLGVAQHAIEAFKALAETKVHSASQRPLMERPAAQAALAKAESLVRSARLFFYDSVQTGWDIASSGTTLPPEQAAVMRLACVTAAENSAAAVDLLWRVAGSTSISESCELERCSRDVHAAAQHVQVQEGNWEVCGRVLMGMEPGTFLF
jgi:indole-3-acetate monooxygenase